MKVRTLKYIVKEGFLNTYKNKLMSLASVSIVMASLLIFGIFLLFIVNLNHNTRTLKQSSEIKVFCEYELDDVQVKNVEQSILANKEVLESKMVSKEEAFEKFRDSLGEDARVLEGYGPELLPVSFILKLKDPGTSTQVAEELRKIPGVRKVSFSRELNDFISKFTGWINLLSGVMIALLLVFSVSIIANTIKLTVFARRKEISIMKYIGATDWFIRWPFVVEGVIIGLAGALVAFALTRVGYLAVENRFSSDLSNISLSFIKIVKMGEVNSLIIMSYALLGSVVGAIGSLLSIRKYLKV